MNVEQIKALGISNLSDEDINKIVNASTEELKEYVLKTKFDEVNSAKKQLETDVKDRDKQIEEIKKNAGDNEELKKQIETLQNENKTSKEKYEAELKDLQISNAIKLAISDKAQDSDLVVSLFDKTKLILSEDGKITGLDEQLKALKEGKPFLFKEEKTTEPPNQGFKFGVQGNPQQSQQGEFSMKNAIQAKIQAQMGK
ncbi:MAG: phage scaffolding protein [Clostridium sp.]|jgi:phage minor structural protein GP20